MTDLGPALRTYWVEGLIVATLVVAATIGLTVSAKNAPFASQPTFALPAKASPVTSLENIQPRHEEPFVSLDAVSVNGKLVPGNAVKRLSVQRNDRLSVSGWAADRVAGAPANAIFLGVGSQKPIALQYGGNRPDVAQALGNPGLVRTGYVGKVPPGYLTPGDLPLTFLVVDSSGLTYDTVPSPVSLAVR